MLDEDDVDEDDDATDIVVGAVEAGVNIDCVVVFIVLVELVAVSTISAPISVSQSGAAVRLCVVEAVDVIAAVNVAICGLCWRE